MDELKPCPFCGGEAQPALVQGGGIEWAQVECVDPKCGAVGPTPATEAEAIAAWNTRPAPSPADAGLVVQQEGASFGPGSHEPSPKGLGPSGFDPSRWGELCCAIANARYALEFWEREALVASRRSVPIPPKLLEWCLVSGREQCASLREMEQLVRPLAYPPRDSDGPRMAETQSGSGRSRTSAGRQASPETPALKAGAPNEENDHA